MPALSIDAIRTRAAKFAQEFSGVTSEKQRDQDYMRGFCQVFGVNPNRMQWQFVLKDGKTTTWADGVLPGMALFEMKTAGKDLAAAYEQAANYKNLMKDTDVPQLIIISDFANIHVYNGAIKTEFALAQLAENVDCLSSLAGYETIAIERQNAINEAAAEKIARLHDLMKANHYRGKDLETYLVRLLFCLFADDTGLFGENNQFMQLVTNTKVDGTDLHGELERLFNTLNKDTHERPPNLPDRFKGFPYVNGSLFADKLENPYDFDEVSRTSLLELTHEDWSEIDPSIFGSLFQAIMHHEDESATAKTKKRRELGAHYTSETNILKVINPLFMEDLRKEFESVKRSPKALEQFHNKLSSLQLFDPACGCGNFLVVAYRELRLLELEVIEVLHGSKQKASKQQSDVALMVKLDVDQFHGIEIDSTAARIATVAMWLTDHQMNLKVGRLGGYMHRLPLKKKPNIVCGNALRIDWPEVIAPEKCSYIMGNPPFIGSRLMNKDQKQDLMGVFERSKDAGEMDYVSAWYIQAAKFIKNTKIKVAFVSTNSIVQGLQAGILWTKMINKYGITIHFAHRTFRWSNDGRGVAAVYCVIIGFGNFGVSNKLIFDYMDINGEPLASPVKNINAYLLDANNIFIEKLSNPLCNVPEMNFGNMPADGGEFLFTDEEKEAFLILEPDAEKFFKRFISAQEFINNKKRWCLWLADIKPNELKKLGHVKNRVANVKSIREKSSRPQLANTPNLFAQITQPMGLDYILIPRHSSENRSYIPIGFFDSVNIAADSCLIIPKGTLFHFGVLTSTMHMAWVKTVCGRLESRYRYSKDIVYNNFPWPDNASEKHKQNIENAAQAVLDARSQFPDASLADLYDPVTMPVVLLKAHQALDKAVDAAYENDGYDKKKTSDADRVAFLFTRYEALTKPLLPADNSQPEKKAAGKSKPKRSNPL